MGNERTMENLAYTDLGIPTCKVIEMPKKITVNYMGKIDFDLEAQINRAMLTIDYHIYSTYLNDEERILKFQKEV